MITIRTNKYNIYRLYTKEEIINICSTVYFVMHVHHYFVKLWTNFENSYFYFERVHYCGGSIVSKLGYDGEGLMDIEVLLRL